MSDENKDTTVHPDDKGADKKISDSEKSTAIPKHRFDEINEKYKATKAELQEIAEELKKDVPEEMRDLIPDLPSGQLIKWLRNASAKGLFVERKTESLDTKRPNEKKVVNFESMSTHEKIAHGYRK